MSILVPIDASAPARAAVEVATSLAQARNEGLVLIHTHTGPDPAGLGLLAELHNIAEPVRHQGVEVSLRVLRDAPVSGLCAWVKSHDISLIVTGTRGPLDLAANPRLSTARTLSMCAPVPVVAVRPGSGGLGTQGGHIHLVTPAHRTAQDIALGLGETWSRTTHEVQPLADVPLLSGGAADDETSLTVISVADRAPWSAWCEAVLMQARGTLLIVTRGSAETKRQAPSAARRASTR